MRRCLAAIVAMLLADVATAQSIGVPVALVNAGFESTKPGVRGDPEGWVGIQHAGPLSYTFKVDTAIRHGGERSLRIDNAGPEPFGAIFHGPGSLWLDDVELVVVAR